MPQTVEEALGMGSDIQKPPTTVEEALAGNLPIPKRYANFGGQPAEIDLTQRGIERNEGAFLANFGGPAKFQQKWLEGRGYKVSSDPDTGQLLVLGSDLKARPIVGPADWAAPERYVMDTAAMLAGGLGGKLAGMIPGRIGTSVLAGLLPGQVAGVAGTRLAQQAVGQSQGANVIDPKAIGKESAVLYGAGALGYGGAQLFGRGGGIPAENIRESVLRPGLTRQPPPEAERTLSEQLMADTEKQARTPTLGHAAYQKEFLEPVEHATLDAAPYVQAIRNQITGADNPAMRTADRALEGFAKRLEARAAAGGGRMTAGQIDSWITDNLTDPLKGAYTRGSEAVFANALMQARTEMTQQLYKSLGEGATSAQALANRSLNVREAAEKTFPAFDKAGKVPVATGAERLRLVVDEGPQGQTLRQVLQAYDTEHGTDFYRRASDLATKRLWTAADRVKAQVIDNMLKPQYLRLGVIKQASRIIGKQLVRGTGQIVSGGSALTAPSKKPKVDPETAAPEELFPGMTNAPPQER